MQLPVLAFIESVKHNTGIMGIGSAWRNNNNNNNNDDDNSNLNDKFSLSSSFI